MKINDERALEAKENLKIYKKYKNGVIDRKHPLKLNEKYFSLSAVNPFITYNSSPRGLMLSGQLGNSLTLVNPDKKILQTKMDLNLGDTAIKVKIKNDALVLNVVPRYKSSLGINKGVPVEYIIIFKDLVTDMIDCVEIKPFNRDTNYFGFEFKIDRDYIENLSPGDIIGKGKVLAWSPSLNPETGEYGFGKTLNVCLATHDMSGEDGVIISESAREKLKISVIDRRTLDTGSDSFLLNINGDENVYKPFSEIGEEISSTGVVFAKRDMNDKFGPSIYSKKDTNRFNPIFDKVVYGRNFKSKVVDLKVFFSNKRKKLALDGTDDLLNKYSKALKMYYSDLIRSYEKIEKEYGEDVRFSPNLNRLIVEAYGILFSSGEKSKIKKNYRNERLDMYRIDMDLKTELYPGIQYKITGLAGDKGVVTAVLPDEELPVDENGVRADVVLNSLSTYSRLNDGRLYERYLSATSRRAKAFVEERWDDNPFKNTDEQAMSIMEEIILPYLSIWNNDQYRLYKKAYEDKEVEAIRELIQEIVDEEFYVMTSLDSEKRAEEVALEMESTMFRPAYGYVTYMKNGKKKISKNKVMIAPMYLFLLDKIGDSLLATSSPKINHIGLPIGPSKNDRYDFPYKNAPLRISGETETRAYAAYVGREWIAELLDRGASPTSHVSEYETILKAENPTNIDRCIDREKIPYGKHKPLDIFKTLFRSNGVALKYKKDKHIEYYQTDETSAKEISIYDVDEVIEDSEED